MSDRGDKDGLPMPDAFVGNIRRCRARQAQAKQEVRVQRKGLDLSSIRGSHDPLHLPEPATFLWPHSQSAVGRSDHLPGPSLGGRHHLPEGGRALALPCRSDGQVQPQDRGLEAPVSFVLGRQDTATYDDPIRWLAEPCLSDSLATSPRRRGYTHVNADAVFAS